MSKLNTNSPALETEAILRWLTKVQSWSSFSGQTKNRVKALLENNPINSLDDVKWIVAQTSLQGRKAKSLQTSLGIVVAWLLQGKKPDEIMGSPDSPFQLWDYMRRRFDEEANMASGEKYNPRGEPLAVDQILQKVSR